MVFEKVREIICEQLDLGFDEVELTSRILEDLDADSLDIIDLSMSFQEEFGIEMSEEELESIKTVEDIVVFIEENIAE